MVLYEPGQKNTNKYKYQLNLPMATIVVKVASYSTTNDHRNASHDETVMQAIKRPDLTVWIYVYILKYTTLYYL